MGYREDRYQPWEDDLIRQHWGAGEGRGLLLQMLHDRSPESLRGRAWRLGIHARYAWTVAEDKILRQCHPDMEKAQVRLKGRTREALYNRSRKLRLGPPVKSWSAAEDDVLRKLAPIHNDEQIATILGRTAHAILRRRNRLGLTRTVPKNRVFLPVVADVIGEAKTRGVNLPVLTRALGYRQVVAREDARRVSHEAVAKVVSVFGGHLYAEWED